MLPASEPLASWDSILSDARISAATHPTTPKFDHPFHTHCNAQGHIVDNCYKLVYHKLFTFVNIIALVHSPLCHLAKQHQSPFTSNSVFSITTGR